MKVAILGLSPSRDLAPWSEPDWELWGLAWDNEAVRMHRAFEMHERSLIEDKAIERLNDLPTLYVQHAMVEVPCGVVYPFDEVANTTGAYWTSSLGYMLALAIHEGAEEIGIWGVDMTDGYGYQRPNMEYLIGFARGRGIKVTLAPSSPLCKFTSDPDFDYDGRYGRLNGRNH